MAENLVASAFTGGTSFMTNHYAIWRKGLGKQSPNWYAVKQGETYAQRMFYDKSTNSQSSYSKLVNFLQRVEQKEAQKELALITSQIAKIEKVCGSNNTRIKSAKEAALRQEFGLAYTFLIQSDEEMKKFIIDCRKMIGEKDGNITHSSLFKNAEFSTVLAKKLMVWIEQKMQQDAIKENLTLEEIVEQWIDQAIEGSSGVFMTPIQQLKEQTVARLKNYFLKRGLLLSESTTNKSKISIKKLKQYMNSKGYLKTKKGRSRSIKQSVDMFSKEVGGAVVKGLSQELSQTGKQGRGGVSINTGGIMKEIEKSSTDGVGKVQIKNDVVSYVLDQVEIDYEFMKTIFDDYITDETSETLLGVEEYLQKLSTILETNIFKISTNVKGYATRNDLKIEGEGSFRQRTINLQRIANEASGIPAFSIDKMLFMLNNTMPGCIAENRVHHLIDYLAAICVAWMWDDYTDLLSVDQDVGAINTIHMFSSGGVYYSASQILRKTRENLMHEVGQSNSQFVNIQINPPSFDANSEYNNLRDQFPIIPGMEYEEKQNLLAKRWDAMRDKIEQEGTIAIYFKQQQLENIISDLSGILKL